MVIIAIQRDIIAVQEFATLPIVVKEKLSLKRHGIRVDITMLVKNTLEMDMIVIITNGAVGNVTEVTHTVVIQIIRQHLNALQAFVGMDHVVEV